MRTVQASHFGHWASHAGTAVALLSWAHQVLHPGRAQGRISSFDSAPLLVEHIKAATEPALRANGNVSPRIIVMSALGRCGAGAVDFARAAGILESSILQWDLNETKAGGPFKEIAESDILINCVYLGPNRAPPSITFESLTAVEDRRLWVICDVSCDPDSENNSIPGYLHYNSFEKPIIPTSREVTDPKLHVVAIDHLPTLVAHEVSNEFSQLFLPSLLTIDRQREEGVWMRAENVFNSKIQELLLHLNSKEIQGGSKKEGSRWLLY